jgi:hypothetical protein
MVSFAFGQTRLYETLEQGVIPINAVLRQHWAHRPPLDFGALSVGIESLGFIPQKTMTTKYRTCVGHDRKGDHPLENRIKVPGGAPEASFVKLIPQGHSTNKLCNVPP